MALFRFGRPVSIRWNGLLIEGVAGTVFEVPDEYWNELQDAMRVEPTFEWVDSDEAATLRGRVTVLESTAISLSDSNPLALGTAAPGAGTSPSRYDHIHPTTGLSLSSHLHNGTYAGITHAHTESDVTSLVSDLASKAASVHTHSESDVTNLVSDLAGKALSSHLHTGVYDPAGTATTALSGHTSATDPHPIYLTQTEADAFYAALTHTHTGLAAAYTSVIQQYVKNDGTAKSKGEAVYISSANGTNPIISYANASSEATSSKTLGLLTDNVAANEFVYVITEGILSGINTSAATAGQSVYLDTTNGQRKYGSPATEPAHGVYLGIVTRSNTNNGEMFVKVQNGYELDELHDVSVTSPSDGDLIQWVSSTSLWTKKSISAAGIAASGHNHNGTYATSSHSHAESDVTSLVSDLAAKAASVHTHAESDVTSLVTDLAGKASSSHLHTGTYDPAGTASTAVSTHAAVTTSVHGISNTANLVYTSDSRLSDSRTPTTHTHAESDVTSLVTDLAGKASTSHTHSYASTTHASTHVAAGSDPLSGISPSQITGTAVITSDSRLSDSRTPTAHTHTQSESHNSADTDTGTSSLHHTIGTGANQASAGNHTHTALAPAGSVTIWLGSNASVPSGWLMCAGGTVSRSTYSALFTAIGTTFGAGDGSTTFGLPDLTGHMLVGASVTAPAQTGSADSYLNATWDHNHVHSHVTNPAAFTSASASAAIAFTASGSVNSASTGGHTHSIDVPATTSDTDSTTMSVAPTQKRTRVNYIIKT
jgi:microcystin-dependent protein